MTPDIRQSANWGKYLEYWGWESHRTSSGVNVEVLKKFKSNFAKIQRPVTLSQEDMDEIDIICKNKKCIFVKLEPEVGQNLDLLKSNGYKVSKNPLSPPSTLIIDLKKDQETLWSDLSKSCKYSINRAQREKNTVHIKVFPWEEELSNFHKLLKSSAKKTKATVYPVEDLYTKAEIFQDKCFLATSHDENGKILGGNLFLGYEDKIWYVHGGTAKEGRKTKAGYLLYWDSILYFKQLGYSFLDLEGIEDARYSYTQKWKGFSDFKKKFGGALVEYPNPYVKIYNKLIGSFAKISGL